MVAVVKWRYIAVADTLSEVTQREVRPTNRISAVSSGRHADLTKKQWLDLITLWRGHVARLTEGGLRARVAEPWQERRKHGDELRAAWPP